MYRGFKISKNPLSRNSKNHNFSPQLDTLELCQNADEAENLIYRGHEVLTEPAS
jgi:hypothetical protein